MAATLNVYVKDRATGLGIGNARVQGLTRNQIIDPPVRQTSGDGGANLYYQGPGFVPPVDVTLIVDAAGYAPWSTGDQPIHFGVHNIDYTLYLDSFRKPFRAAPRFWKANMCGTRVPGVEAVPGGAADASLVLSWFYDRYTPESRAAIRAAWKAKGLTHVLLSWPDSRSFGQSIAQFRATCQELAEFFTCVFLSSKDHDPADVATILAGLAPVLDALVGIVPMFCIGWELSLWLSPTQVQQLIDAIAPRCLQQPGTLVYPHFQEGYSSFQQPDQMFADFWNLNVGKLTGVLHQKILSQTKEQYRTDSGGLVDVLERFAGGFNVAPDSGFGHPFDLVALEITAMQQFNGTCSEDEGDELGQWAIATPAVIGPLGPVQVMGSGNGF